MARPLRGGEGPGGRLRAEDARHGGARGAGWDPQRSSPRGTQVCGVQADQSGGIGDQLLLVEIWHSSSSEGKALEVSDKPACTRNLRWSLRTIEASSKLETAHLPERLRDGQVLAARQTSDCLRDMVGEPTQSIARLH